MPEGATSTTCVLFDLVGMQTFNDKNGWDAGDKLLIAIMAVLMSCFASTSEVTRLSGDEFLVVTPDGDTGLSANRARHASEEIQRRFGVTVVFGVGSNVALADARQSAIHALFEHRASR